MNYDTMRVHELVNEIFNAGVHSEVFREEEDDDRPALEFALRKAVIREASVQTFHIKTKKTARNEYGTWNECEVNGVKQDRISALRHLPDGDYALVPIPRKVQP